MRRSASLLATTIVAGLLSGGAAGAQSSPSLHFGPCPRVPQLGCATLRVAADHARPSLPGSITLAVRRHLAGPTPSASAVLALAGGPGQAAIPLTAAFAHEMAPALRTRDLLVTDQRGTGQSRPLHCAALSLNAPELAIAARCARQIGPMRGLFTTAQTVDDLEALRQAAGYRQLVLYGTSYGTKVALEYAERYPQNVESLVLDSVVGVSGPDALVRPTLAAVPRVLGDLCTPPACAGISADPVGEVARLVRRMRAGALSGDVFDGRGRRQSIRMGRGELLDLFLAGDQNPALRAELPAAVHSALHRDPAPLLRLNLLAQGLVPNTVGGPNRPTARRGSGRFDIALFAATLCEEEHFPWTPRSASLHSRVRQAEAAARQLALTAVYPFDRLTALTGGEIPLCLGWPVASPVPPMDAPLPNVPALIISGATDLRTPTEEARAAAARIPDATLLVVPHAGHSTLGQDLTSCSARAVSAFFAGHPIVPCRASGNPFAPTGVAPLRVGRLTRTPGVRDARASRTLTAVRETLVDLRREIVGALLAAAGRLPRRSGFGGLRGGTTVLVPGAVSLRAFSFVPGVTLSGRLPISLLAFGRGSATLGVGGAEAARGRVRLLSGRQLAGTLGGHRFSLNLAARALGGAQWRWPATVPALIARWPPGLRGSRPAGG